MIRSLVVLLAVLASSQSFAECVRYANYESGKTVAISANASAHAYLMVENGRFVGATDVQTQFFDFIIEDDVTFANGDQIAFRSRAGGLVSATDLATGEELSLDQNACDSAI